MNFELVSRTREESCPREGKKFSSVSRTRKESNKWLGFRLYIEEKHFREEEGKLLSRKSREGR